MNQLEQHDNMIRKSERILLLKTISHVFYSLDTMDDRDAMASPIMKQMRIYINKKLDDESNIDKKRFNNENL